MLRVQSTRWIIPLFAASSLWAVEFNRDIRPIFSDRCFSCHGPDHAKRQTAMRLDQERSAKAQLKSGRLPLVAGQPDASEVFIRITAENKALRMPPTYLGHDKLPEREIALIRQWIEEGAAYQDHWAFLAPKKASADGNAIDYFVRRKLEREGLKPAPEADRRTLIRRVTLDLTGLPPTPAEIGAFVEDKSPKAYELVVDRLLASPRYAERMAVRWLDAARYADTNGYQSDGPRDMWRWRDWVIDAFDKNMPFDQFTVEQLAGDLLPNATLSQRIATAFHRNHRTSAEGGIIDEEFRTEYVADRAETTATVWLGLTFTCSRCHDHKYDPMTQKDFYSLFAFFNNVPEKGFVYNFGNERPFIPAPLPDQESKLALLRKAAADAQSKWQAARARLKREQRAWERKLAKEDVDWVPSESLVLDGERLSDTKFDSQRVVDYGEDKAKFNYRDPYTLAAWVKPKTMKGAILARAEDYWEGSGYGLYVIDGKLRFHYIFRWTDLGIRFESKQALKQNEWQHVAVTYDGNMYAEAFHLYVDGQEVEKNVLFNSNLWPLGHKARLRLGAGAGLNFEGEMDQPRIWARTLSAAEVAAVSRREILSGIARRKKRSATEQAKLDVAFEQQFLPAKWKQVREDWMAAQKTLRDYEKTIPTVMVMQEGPRRDAFILRRGAYDQKETKVEAATPHFLPPLPAGAQRNRLGLARWLVSRENPLTARVTVNRFWQMLWGTGLVKTTEDFGSQGEWPIHPELLDWLAVNFMDSGWNVKQLFRTIVTSATYRQSALANSELLTRDPENRLLARGPRTRLPAEMIRDQALAVSGLLVAKAGGPSVKPYQPPGLWQELSGGSGYKPDSGEGLYRRSLYTYWRRTIPPPSAMNFDSASRETCIVRESRTNTPLQALNLMNDETYVEAARKLAERILREGAARPVEYAYETVLGRAPSGKEKSLSNRLIANFVKRYADDETAAKKLLAVGASPRDEKLPAAELAAYTQLASMILNLDEAVTKP